MQGNLCSGIDPHLTNQKRVVWLEVSRVLATFLVVWEHMPYPYGIHFGKFAFLRGSVPFFFFVAGLLSMRKGVVKGQWFNWSRAVFLLVPFVIWEVVAMANALFLGKEIWSFPHSLVVLTCINKPLWFMRDLILLSLVTPLLLRFHSKLIALAVAIMAFDYSFGPDNRLLPSTWGIYILGLGLNRYDLDGFRKFLDKNGIYIIGLTFTLAAGFILKGRDQMPVSELFHIFHGACFGVFGLILGAMSIMSAGVLIEKYLPSVASRIAPIGISSFLIYAVHWPFLVLICSFIGIRPYCPVGNWNFWGHIPVFIAAVGVYAVIHWGYLLIERFFPRMLPFLAAQRIRDFGSAKREVLGSLSEAGTR